MKGWRSTVVRTATLICCLTIVAGCSVFTPAGDQGDREAFETSRPRLHYAGFSIKLPSRDDWYLLRSEQAPDVATLRIDLDSQTHSLVGRAQMWGLAQRMTTREEFAEMFRRDRGWESDGFEIIEYSQSLGTDRGDWCLRYSVRLREVQTTAPGGKPFEIHLRGFTCPHSSTPLAVLDAYWAERGLSTEMDPTLSERGDRFLQSIRIDPVPEDVIGDQVRLRRAPAFVGHA